MASIIKKINPSRIGNDRYLPLKFGSQSISHEPMTVSFISEGEPYGTVTYVVQEDDQIAEENADLLKPGTAIPYKFDGASIRNRVILPVTNERGGGGILDVSSMEYAQITRFAQWNGIDSLLNARMTLGRKEDGELQIDRVIRGKATPRDYAKRISDRYYKEYLLGRDDFIEDIPKPVIQNDDYQVVGRRSLKVDPLPFMAMGKKDPISPQARLEEQRNGLICAGGCGNSYPYAEPNQDDGSFICYSCRTGL